MLLRGEPNPLHRPSDTPDHSRYAVASHVAWGETSEGAITVVDKGIAVHGVPQRLLSDNGAALNASRRGVIGQLVTHVRALGVEPITGKPYKPTTQGKNERFHQTLFRWLDKQPIADTLEQLQGQVDRFDIIYNTERPHQGLPGRITPLTAWDVTPKADPPRPPSEFGPISVDRSTARAAGVDEIHIVMVRINGTVYARRTFFYIDKHMAGQTAYVIEDIDRVQIFDDRGTLIIERPWPPPGTKYVGNKQPAKQVSRDCCTNR